jgi:hypothetical protein
MVFFSEVVNERFNCVRRKGEGNISLNSKYAVMWRLLCPSSIAYQNIPIETVRKLRKFSGMVLSRFERSLSTADDMHTCARLSMLCFPVCYLISSKSYYSRSNSEFEYF